MPSSAPDLVIPFVTSELPTCNPDLMPFHISYSGHAAVSAYMRIEKALPELSTIKDAKDENLEEMGASTDLSESPAIKISPANADVQMDVSVSAMTAQPTLLNVTADQDMQTSIPTMPSLESVGSESQTLSITTESTLLNDSQTPIPSDISTVSLPPPVLDDADKRFVSTFRGRTIHGLTVDLPPGYSGLVLQSEAEGASSDSTKEDTTQNTRSKDKGKATEKETAAKPRGRLTRSAVSKRSEVITVEDDDVEMAGPDSNGPTDDPDTVAAPIDDRPIRNLVPKSQFSSFTLWHADRPVDKGSDEYFRTLTEWISLAHEVRLFSCC